MAASYGAGIVLGIFLSLGAIGALIIGFAFMPLREKNERGIAWNNWSAWSACSATCGYGSQSSIRRCIHIKSSKPEKGCTGSYNRTQQCFTPCPVDGGFGSWGPWGECSKTCKGGNAVSIRSCDNPAPKNNGKPCDGVPTKVQTCNGDIPCPAPPEWGSWAEWSQCSVTCGKGTQTATRHCNKTESQHGQCLGMDSKSQACDTNVGCPVDGKWSKWTHWDSCSVTCDAGTKRRSRTCTNPSPLNGGAQCQGEDSEVETCNLLFCPVDGSWGSWDPWNTCSSTCKGGTQIAQRQCNSPAPIHGGKPCGTDSTKQQACNNHIGCPVDGSWGHWGSWDTCSSTCQGGTQQSQRKCNSPAPLNGGKSCNTDNKRQQNCNTEVECPVDGNWGNWGSWETCSSTCKSGSQIARRECNSPAPLHGGKTCGAENSKEQICSDDIDCPVDGNWGEWGEWGTCSSTCKGGIQVAKRMCDNPAPLHGGKTCFGDSSKQQDCNKDIDCPVDGNWGNWGDWGTCSSTCKGGTHVAERDCNNPAPLHGGKLCTGESNRQQDCNVDISCPVDGEWGNWGAWEACSSTCKSGTQLARRECNNPAPQHGGKSCGTDSTKEQVCNDDIDCPVDGKWSNWGDWGFCSSTCKGGTQIAQRECNNPAPLYGGEACDGDSSKQQDCNDDVECPVNGNWGVWSGWGLCSSTCKGGTHVAMRNCDNPVPQHGGKMCSGDSSKQQDCNNDIDCPVDGKWGNWGGWGVCSSTCKGGTQVAQRECSNPAPLHGGRTCIGGSIKQQDCNDDVECPVNGKWGDWEGWGVCSSTCKGGTQVTKRQCDNPAPQHGGQLCSGDNSKQQDCNDNIECPVDGKWGIWGGWGPCSSTCKGGTQVAKRNCDNPSPLHGGKTCSGDSSKQQGCNDDVNCPVDGKWGNWGGWGSCSSTCKGGNQVATRMCDNPAPLHGGESCIGDSSKQQDCNYDVNCPVDGQWGNWGEWGVCSSTCKGGTQVAKRKCDNPSPQHGGKSCSGDTSKQQDCNDHIECPIDGNWGIWSGWGSCSSTCKGGTQVAKRNCDNPSPLHGGKICIGDSTKQQDCNDDINCPVDGKWGNWGGWGSCSSTCKGGTQYAKRKCDNPAPQHGGASCGTESTKQQACNSHINCPVNGQWSNWGGWGGCSVTCGSGSRIRTRSCTNPAPQYGGSKCSGGSTSSISCTLPACKVDGNWSGWLSQGLSKGTCGAGFLFEEATKYVRHCNSPAPQNGGKTCPGSDTKYECRMNIPCPCHSPSYATASRFLRDDRLRWEPPFAFDKHRSPCHAYLWHTHDNEIGGLAWLQIDLQGFTTVYRIAIFDRVDAVPERFNSFEARVGSTATTGGQKRISYNTLCGAPMPGQYHVHRNHYFDCGIRGIYGRYVTLQKLRGGEHAHISEVYVDNRQAIREPWNKYKCFWYDEDNYSNDIHGRSGYAISDIWACQADCQRHSGCQEFLYFESKCWLKYAVPFADRRVLQGLIAGPKYC